LVVDGIDQQTYTKLQMQGYSDYDIQAAVNRQREQEKLNSSYESSKTFIQNNVNRQSMFTRGEEENLIKWQLELDSILERIEHILRGDEVSYRNGDVCWSPAKEGETILNNYGVNKILKIISSYLNRNTILSNYDEPTINFKVYDIGCEISDTIFLEYEKMGLSDIDKRKEYPMLVRQIVDMIHSSYLRALNGGERDSLREARSIIQNEQMQPNVNVLPAMRERGALNPFRYIIGKQK